MKNLLLLLALATCSAAPALAQTKKPTAKATAASKAAAAKAAAAKAKAAAKPAAVVAPPAAPVVPLTADEASSGLREALTTGITKAIAFASEPDGFNLNDDIHIPLPPDAALVATTVGALPGGKILVEQSTNLLNRAAEAAAPQAKAIFLDALQKLTITDALTLATSLQKDAATQLLRRNAEAALATALKPSIVQSLDQVGANATYGKLIAQYNRIPLMTPASADLTDYVTKQTVSGLFVLLAQQEAKIRQNPAAQGSALLKRVFGK